MNLNDDVSTYTVGGVGLAFGLRLLWSALKGLSLKDAATDAHKEALANAQAEAKKWEAYYVELKSNHEENLILIGELRVQNKMLRMILIQRGMTGEEIDTALEIDHGPA